MRLIIENYDNGDIPPRLREWLDRLLRELRGVVGNDLTLSRIGSSTYSTIQHLMNLALSAGYVSGGTITDAGGGAIDVAAGTGFIRTADDEVSTLSFFDWAASAGISIPSDSVRYVGIEYNAGAPQVVVKTSATWNYDTEFPIGEVVNEGGTLSILQNPWRTADSIADIIERFDATGYITRDGRSGGLILSNSGTRNVAVTAGQLISRLSKFPISAIDTSVSGSFDAYYQDGSGGWTKESAQTQWNNSNYDDGSGTLAALTSGNYTSRWFYLMTDGTLAMVYGQSQSANLASARADTAPASVPDRIRELGISIGRIIAQEGTSTPAVVQSAFTTEFSGNATTEHNQLAGLQGGTSGEYYHLTNTQLTNLLALLNAAFQNLNIVVYETSDTYSKPDNLLFALVIVVGGGGGSGGCQGTGSGEENSSSAGGGGGSSIKLIPAGDLSASETVTIGAGGSGGSAGNNDGSAGGTTSFGAHCSATGGGGGGGGSATSGNSRSSGTAGGVGSNGDINLTGGYGVGRQIQSGRFSRTNYGGSSLLSPGGAQGVSSAVGYGGGGGGESIGSSSSASAGFAGSDGVVVVIEVLTE